MIFITYINSSSSLGGSRDAGAGRLPIWTGGGRKRSATEADTGMTGKSHSAPSAPTGGPGGKSGPEGGSGGVPVPGSSPGSTPGSAPGGGGTVQSRSQQGNRLRGTIVLESRRVSCRMTRRQFGRNRPESTTRGWKFIAHGPARAQARRLLELLRGYGELPQPRKVLVIGARSATQVAEPEESQEELHLEGADGLS